MKLDKNKKICGNIPRELIKTVARKQCVPVTNINATVSNNGFPDELKLVGLTAFYEKSKLDFKTNYIRISVGKQLSLFFETELLVCVVFVRGINLA